MYESIHVRLLKEQYEWLRKYCFDHRVSQAEVIREALELFKDKKEENQMTWAEVRDGYHVAEVNGAKLEAYWDDQPGVEAGWAWRITRADGSIDGDAAEDLADAKRCAEDAQ